MSDRLTGLFERYKLSLTAIAVSIVTERLLWVQSKTTPNDGGLCGDPYQGTVELEFAPQLGDAPAPVALRLQYTGAKVNRRNISVGALNAEWKISPTLGFFGRYGLGSITGETDDSFAGFAHLKF